MAKEADFSELEKYLSSFKTMTEDFNEFLRNFIYKEAERVIAKTKRRTPVDTGALKAAWDIESIVVNGDTIEAIIVNPMEYATFVEYGHTSLGGDWIAGYFMVTISIDDVQRQLPKRFEKQFYEFVKSKGVG